MEAQTNTEALAAGTAVEITGTGVWGKGTLGRIERAYTIRHGHHMYDVKSIYGSVYTYYGREQLTVLPEGMAPEKLATFRNLEYWRTNGLPGYLTGLDKMTDAEVCEYMTWMFEQRKPAAK